MNNAREPHTWASLVGIKQMVTQNCHYLCTIATSSHCTPNFLKQSICPHKTRVTNMYMTMKLGTPRTRWNCYFTSIVWVVEVLQGRGPDMQLMEYYTNRVRQCTGPLSLAPWRVAESIVEDVRFNRQLVFDFPPPLLNRF